MDIALAVSGAEPGAIVLRQTFMSKMWVSRTLARLSELVNSKDYKILVQIIVMPNLGFRCRLKFWLPSLRDGHVRPCKVALSLGGFGPEVQIQSQIEPAPGPS